jgi:hypothetical protein
MPDAQRAHKKAKPEEAPRPQPLSRSLPTEDDRRKAAERREDLDRRAFPPRPEGRRRGVARRADDPNDA